MRPRCQASTQVFARKEPLFPGSPAKLLSDITFWFKLCFFIFLLISYFRFMAKDTDLAMNAMQQTNLTVSYILYACTYGYAVVIDNV